MSDAVKGQSAGQAADGILGPNPFVGMRPGEIAAAAQQLMSLAAGQPLHLARAQFWLLGELGRIATGASQLTPEKGDRRFDDPDWLGNPAWRMLMQSYLAWRRAVFDYLDMAGLGQRDGQRLRYVASLFTEALSPTNALATNPAGLKRLVETRGESLLRGWRNYIDDAAANGGMPRQVDAGAFELGRNIATTSGAVVHRSEVLELIQYKPQADRVRERPLIFVPSQINKFYVYDLSPPKSLIQYALKAGLNVFAVSWRNPTAAARDWGLDAYIEALEQAVDAAAAIGGSGDANILGACSGGITCATLAAHLARRGATKLHALTLVVSLLDTESDGQMGLFASPEGVAAAKRQSTAKGVLDGRDMARVFAWMRPNDLVWNYWVNNYVLGNEPPAFDVLYWNCDTTRLPARLHGEFMDMYMENPLPEPGRLVVRGTPIDLGAVASDAYLVAGLTDHITPWQACYRSARLLGGPKRFILGSSGHIQSIINPPGNAKSKYLIGGDALPDAPDDWLVGAKEVRGSWWEDWRQWITARSGEERQAPADLGDARHRPDAPAPGIYVRDA